MRRGSDPLKLRIFIDRSIVEVFANNKQYLAMRVYPERGDSLGVSLRAQGQDAVLKHLQRLADEVNLGIAMSLCIIS